MQLCHHWPTVPHPTHHVILITSGQDQGVGTVIAATVDARHVWPMDPGLAHLGHQKTQGLLSPAVRGMTDGTDPGLPTSSQASHPFPPARRYLHSELPHGAHGDARDGPVVVGGDDGAFLGAAHAGHALGQGSKGWSDTGQRRGGIVRKGQWMGREGGMGGQRQDRGWTMRELR